MMKMTLKEYMTTTNIPIYITVIFMVIFLIVWFIPAVLLFVFNLLMEVLDKMFCMFPYTDPLRFYQLWPLHKVKEELARIER